jgi:hypothetical protein
VKSNKAGSRSAQHFQIKAMPRRCYGVVCVRRLHLQNLQNNFLISECGKAAKQRYLLREPHLMLLLDSESL